MKKRILALGLAIALIFNTVDFSTVAAAAAVEEQQIEEQTEEQKQEPAGDSLEEAQLQEESSEEQKNEDSESNAGITDADTGLEDSENKDSETDAAVAVVQEMIDALPDVDALDDMESDELEKAYADTQTAYEVYEALTEEEQAQLTGTDRFEELFGWFNGQVALLADETAENVAEVTVNDTTTKYTDIDEAFAAAQKADKATVKLLADVTISHSDDSGIKLEKGNITLDLNGKIFNKSTHDDNGFYAKNAVFWLSPPGATTKDEFLAALKTPVRLTVQDSSVDGNGRIVQPNGGPAIIATLNTTLTVNGGTIENTSSDDFDDGRSHMAPNCAVLLSSGGKVVINGGTLRGMRGVAVTGYITKEDEAEYKKHFGIEGYNNDTYGNELTVTGGEISGTSGEALVVYKKAKKIELSGGTFTTQSNVHSIWVYDTEDGEQTFKGDAASLLKNGCRYEYNGAECAYSEDGKGVKGNATVALRPANEYVYIGKDGKLTAQANCTEIAESSDDISTQGWYVLNKDITITSLNISGEVNLILCDGATLTVTNFMNVAEGSTLNLYWQSAGSGKLTAADINVPGTITAPAGEMKKTAGEGGTTYEKCLTHEWSYTVNEGDTHTAKCTLCGKDGGTVAHEFNNLESTTETTHTYSCVCGKTSTGNHTSLSESPNVDGLTHTGRCGICTYSTAPEKHSFTLGGGMCRCFAYLTASYNGQSYSSLASAVAAAAKDGGTVILQKDVAENITIANDMTVTIDLNGKSWTTDGAYAHPTLTVTGGSVTVKNGTLATGSSSNAGTTVVVESGKLTVGENMTIEGGGTGLEDMPYTPAIEVRGGELALSKGTKLVCGMCVLEGKQLKDYLPKGTAFQQTDYVQGATTGTAQIINGYVQKYVGKFTLNVVAHSHTMTVSEDGKYSCVCGYECEHEKFSNGVCDTCGYKCTHPSDKVSESNGTATCGVCKEQMVVKVEKDDSTTYYAERRNENNDETLWWLFNNALESGSTVTLLADDLFAWAYVSKGKTITLNLNGKTLEETFQGITVGQGDTEDKSTNNKLIVKGALGTGEITVDGVYAFRTWAGGELDLSGMESGGKIGGIIADGGKVTTGSSNIDIKIGTLNINNNNTELSFSIGTFDKITGNGGKMLGDLLADGYAFQKADGSYVTRDTEISQTSSLENVTVVKCRHDSVTGSTCDYCGMENIVAAYISNDGTKSVYCAGDDTQDAKNTAAQKAFEYLNNNPGTLKLFADVELSFAYLVATKDPSSEEEVATSQTIDLNGHKLTTGSSDLYVYDALVTLTIKDSSENKGGSIDSVSVEGKLVAESGRIDDLVLCRGSDMNITGGVFGEIKSYSSKQLFEFLREGQAFADAESGDVVNGYESKLENVKVVEHPTHDFKTGKNYTCACGKPCEHVKGHKDNGNCPDCGAPCPHDEKNVTEAKGVYTCDDCGKTMTVRVAHSDKTNTYYSAKVLMDFFANNDVKDGDTVTLLADEIDFDYTAWEPHNATATLDLNGHTLGVSTTASITILNNSTLRIVGSGSFTGTFFTKASGAVLDLSGWTGGTINSVIREASGSKMIPSQHPGTKINNLRLWTNVQYLRELNGGTYGQIKPTSSSYNTTAGALLIEGYAFRYVDEDGKPGDYVPYDMAITEDSPLKDVTVVKCEHTNVDENNKCRYCDGTLVATVKTTSGKTSRYTSFTDALAAANAASGSTLTLLADCTETLTVSAPIKLDCNGHTVDKLTVSDDVTLESLLPEGEAFKREESWVNDSDLSGKTELDNVTMGIAPVKSVTAKNPTITVKYGESYTLSTTFEWTGSDPNSSARIKWEYKGGSYLNEQAPTLSGYSDNKRTMDYSLSTSSTSGYPAKVGTYTYVVTFTKDGYSKSCEFTVTIEKANAEVTQAPTAVADLTYNSTAQALITAGAASDSKLQEMQYSLDGETWQTTIPTGTDAKEYTVWYKAAGSGINGPVNYEESQPQSIKVTIGPKTVDTPTIEVTPDSVYDGKGQTPGVVVKDGETEISESEYTVSYSDNVNAGENTATVTITDKEGGNYTVNGSTKFTIAKAAAPQLNDISKSRKYIENAEQSLSLTDIGMPTDAGTLTYTKGNESTAGSVTVSSWSVDGTGKVTYTLANGKIGETVTLPVTIHSTNYADTTVNVGITLAEKDTPDVKADDIIVTYNGVEVSARRINGTATFDGETVLGSWSWKSDREWIHVSDSGKKTVIFTPDDKTNYESVETKIQLTINQRPVTIVNTAVAQAKVYDGTTVAEITDYGDIMGCWGIDNLTIATDHAKATYTDTDAGTGKTVTFSGFALSGNDKNDYVLSAQPESVKADIAPIELTLTGTISAVDRAYVPGNTTVTLNSDSLVLSGFLGNETVNVSVHEGTMADADVGENKAVTYLPVLTDGENGGKAINYKVVNMPAVTVNITKAAGSITAPTAMGNLVYNGNQQTLIKAGSSVTGEVQYRLGENGTYSTALPTAKDVGTYTVYYKVVGDKNHEDVAEASLQVAIATQTSSESNTNNTANDTTATSQPVVSTPETSSAPAQPKTGSSPVKAPEADRIGATEQTNAQEPYVSGDEGKSGWDQIKDEIWAVIREVQTQNQQTEDSEPVTVTVNMNSATVVPGEIFDSIKGQNISVTFDMGAGILWTVNGMDIIEDQIKDIDFGVSMGAEAGKNIPVDIINNVTGERSSMNLTLNYDGTFGFRAVLTVNVEKTNAGLFANLFYYNPESGELEFICADEIRADGSVDLTFNHASDYLVVIDREPMDGTVTGENDASEDSMDAAVTDTTEPEPTSGNVIWIVLLVIAVILAGAGAVFVWKSKDKKRYKTPVKQKDFKR